MDSYLAAHRRRLLLDAPVFDYYPANSDVLVPQVGSGLSLTFARADASTCATHFNHAKKLVTVAANVPRVDYDMATGKRLGLLVEDTRTNVVRANRDLTDVTYWTPTSVTAAKNQEGIDGTANSASSITATAGNGTILQAITLASSARFQSAYVKRITGSGTINMTMDNGATWTAVTVTSSWTRVTIPTQTMANPTVGFRIVTNGDAIAVDYVQNENGTIATSPIATTTAAVARAADSCTLATSGWYSQTAGTFLASFDLFGAATDSTTRNLFGVAATGDFNNCMYFPRNGSSANIVPTVRYSAALQTPGSPVGAITANTPSALAFTYQTNDLAACLDGGTVWADTSATIPTVAVFAVGKAPWTAGNYLCGHIKRIRYYDKRIPNDQLQLMTTAW